MKFADAPQDASQKSAKKPLEAYTDGSVSLKFFGKMALLGEAKPYYGLADANGIFKNTFPLGEQSGSKEVKKGETMRVEFANGAQVLLKKADGEVGGFALAKPYGINMGAYTDNSIAGQLLIGNQVLDVIYMKQDKIRKALENIASGKTKIADFEAKQVKAGYEITLTTESGDQLLLKIGPKMDAGFRQINEIVPKSAAY